MLRSLAIILLTLSLSGCADDAALAHLIQIRDVAQTWEQPAELSLHGEGFPHGARGEALLTGTLFAVGSPPQRVTLHLPCRALSSGRALVELSASEMAGLREGPFEGQLEVRFGVLSAARLVGRAQHVTFRVGHLPSALDQRFLLRQRAQAFQRSIGIGALEMGERGASISQLLTEGPALAAGLQVGDTIVRLDGAPVQLPVDVLAHGPRAGVELTVQRSGEASTRLINLQGSRSVRSLPWLVGMLCAVLGVSLGATVGGLLRPGALWAPRRREYWLLLVSCGSLLLLAWLVLDSVDPVLRELIGPFAAGFVLAVLAVYLLRRARPTLRTTRDPALAPLL